MSEPSPSAGQRGRVEDPMSADRRTLITAAVAMVALVLVGVVGASLFTRSACEVVALEPGPPAGPAGDQVAAVLAEALGDLSEGERGQLLSELAGVLGDDGEVVAAAAVGGAESLTRLGGDLTATGQTLTVLPAEGGAEAVGFGGQATVVGDGASLFVLALVNELTGQVDALAALGPDLAEQDCTDTATVGVPLAFHLDAGDGRLLLFRVHDDGDGPELQLRGPDGPMWDAEVAVGSGPPGVLAERLTARLGPELVVAARRSLEDEDVPALAAHDLADGEPRWTVDPAELALQAPAGEGALLPRVVAVDPDLVLVALSREQEGPAPTLLVGLDPVDGELRWTGDLSAVGAPRLAGEIDGDPVLLVARDELLEAVRVDRRTGEHQVLHATSGGVEAAAVLDDEVWLGADGGVARVRPDAASDVAALSARVADVAAVHGRLALLLRSDEGGAVVWLQPAPS